MRRFLIAAVMSCLGWSSAQAAPVLFDFESTPFGSYNPLVVSSGALTATITNSVGNVNVQNSGGGAPGWGTHQVLTSNFAFPPGGYFQANFNQGLSSASIQFADFNQDSDTPVTLQAYSGLNGTGSLLDTDSAIWNASASFPNFGSLSVASGTPIQSIRFTGGGPFPNSLFWDNLQVNPNVPEPMSMAIFGGLAVAGLVGYRRRSQAKA